MEEQKIPGEGFLPLHVPAPARACPPDPLRLCCCLALKADAVIYA